MTDRELLERAAKAAGIELLDWCDAWREDDGRTIAAWRTTNRELWNSLTNPADALRLAVALDLRIEPNFKNGRKYVRVGVENDWRNTHDPSETIWLVDINGSDPAETTCRAITIAASTHAPTR